MRLSLIEIVILMVLIGMLLHLAVATDSDQRRIKSLLVNGINPDNWKIIVPVRWLNRRTGLLNRVDVPFGEGLLIAGRRVHTRGMLCAIDLVALGQDGQVVAILEDIKPNTTNLTLPRRTKNVLELGSGGSRQLQLKLGDVISLGELT